MNIFALFDDPVEAAQAHCDKHVIKMILETCLMLYTAHWTTAYPGLVVKGKKGMPLPDSLQNAPTRISGDRAYRYSHVNHPCTKWIRASLQNYLFACELGIALGEEYKYRWSSKKKDHSCEKHVRWLKENPPDLPSIGRTPFALAMDDQYKNSDDPIECYRNYYVTSKKERGLLVYTRRGAPDFVLETYEDSQ
jgi:hypothetical protein